MCGEINLPDVTQQARSRAGTSTYLSVPKHAVYLPPLGFNCQPQNMGKEERIALVRSRDQSRQPAYI